MGSLAELLGDPRWRFRALLGLALASVGLGTYWGIFAWGPELASLVLGPEVSDAEAAGRIEPGLRVMNFTGGFLGLLAFGPARHMEGETLYVHALSRRCADHGTGHISVRTTYTQALWLLPVMAFFVVGMHAGYAIYFPELFPTRLRATGSSFCFNLGRVIGAVILFGRGALGDWLGLRHAVVAVSSLFLVGLVLLWFAPETRGQNLPE